MSEKNHSPKNAKMFTYPIWYGPPSKKKPVSPTTRSLCVIAILGAITMTFLLFSGVNLVEHLPETLRSLGKVQQNRTCIVYERPPRTGSSTVSESLKLCLHRKGYDWGKGPWQQYRDVIPFMLERPSPKKAFVTRHMSIPYWQLCALLGHCNRMFWISSTRAMRHRLASKAKYDVRGKHGNSELARHEEAEFLKNLEGTDEEEMYENYPYIDTIGIEKMLKILPDYIVRTDYLENDLGKLLRALGCGEDVKNRNIHNLNGSGTSDEAIQTMNLKYGDKRHTMMNFLAEHVNEGGLDAAKKF